MAELKLEEIDPKIVVCSEDGAPQEAKCTEDYKCEKVTVSQTESKTEEERRLRSRKLRNRRLRSRRHH